MNLAPRSTAADRVLPQRAVNFLALTVLLLLAGCGPRNDVAERVQLVLSAGELGPGSTFDLRFDDLAIRPEEVGTEPSVPPLVISPETHGRFKWLSQRSGVFTADEPFALNTTYRLTLRPGLRGPDGEPLRARLDKSVSTPAFQVTAVTPRAGSTNAASSPEFKLFFNANVPAAAAASHAAFRSAEGRFVPAHVRQGTEEEMPAWYEIGGGTTATWREQFRFQPHLRNPEASNPTNAVSNFLVITPQKPLPIGKNWRLVISPGLPANERHLRLRQKFEAPVGDITPFMVSDAEVHNTPNLGRRLVVRFSKPLATELTNSIGDWFEVVPPLTNLTPAIAGSVLTLTGDFPLNKEHRLRLRAGLPAEEPFKLEADSAIEFVVAPIDPRLAFPATSADQLATGKRQFPVHVMNVVKVHVRAKLLDLPTVIHGLRGYASYLGAGGYYQGGFERVDYNLVPGQTVFSQVLDGTGEVDVPVTLNLDWDEILGGRKAGVVFLEAERQNKDGEFGVRLGAQAIIQLTDLGLVWKVAEGQALAYVFSHTTGQPARDVTLRLLTSENQVLQEMSSDAQGLARFVAPTNAEWLLAQRGQDLHAVKLADHNISLYHFNLPAAREYDPSPSDRRVLLFSDRAVYRPGETLHLKAIAREWRDGRLAVPEALDGTLACRDPMGREVFRTNVTLGAMGSLDQSIPLPHGTRGHYFVALTLDGDVTRHSVSVQDFQTSAFDVAVKARPSFAAGEDIAIPVAARYYFGKSLSRAKVRWSMEASAFSFDPPQFSEFSFEYHEPGQHIWGPQTRSAQGEADLTDQTNLVLKPEIAPSSNSPSPQSVNLLVEVTDLNQQTISQSAAFVQHSSAFYLGVRPVRDVIAAGETVPVEIVAVAADGNPWPQDIKATLKLSRLDWQSVRVQGAGRTRGFRNQMTVTNLLEKEVVVHPARLHRQDKFTETMEGTRIEGLSVAEAGSYFIEIRARDAGGRETAACLEFSAAAKAALGWDYRNEAQIDLVPDRKQYQAGETAEILVKTPISGDALVTIEREQVRRSFITRLEGNAPTIRVPLQAGDSPNIFVSVMPVRGSAQSPKKAKMPEYRIGYCQLNVEDPRSKLALAVEPGATNYLPGAEVRVSCTVKDSTGTAVPDTEITLWAVDEGVLSLSDYSMPDPHGFFYTARRLGVSSGISLPWLLTEDPEQLEFHNKGYVGGGGGMERVRRNFLPCAAWFASLRTDKSGRCSSTFTAPDSLTRYRIIAVAHTAGHQFGQAQSGFTINKPLMIEPALPCFANVTDRIVARALIYNLTAHAGNVLVSLALDDKARPTSSSNLAQTIAITAEGSAIAEFPVEMIDTGSANWTWHARFVEPGASTAPHAAPSGFTDAVQSNLDIGHVAPLLREIYLGRLATPATNLLARANPQLLEGRGSVTVTLANTRLSELGEAVSQLLHYPYGCVEQTSSSLLPWVVLRSSPAARFLHREPAEIGKVIRSGVARLFSMQTSDGGLGYWPRDREPMLWGSAYAALVLALAQRDEVELPEGDFRKLLSYLSASLRGEAASAREWHDRCLALYALAVAGKPEPAYHEVLFQKRAQLSGEDRALLALAILESRDADAASRVPPPPQVVLPPATPVTPGLAVVAPPAPTPLPPMPSKPWREMVEELLRPNAGAKASSDDPFGSVAREKAIRLLALVLHQPASPAVDQLVADLMGDQRGAHWITTQGNAWALLALTEYARRVEGQLTPAEGTLSWGGATVPYKLGGAGSVFEHTFAITSNALTTPLLLAGNPGARVFTQTRLETRSTVVQQPRQDRGFGLVRTYSRLDDENNPQDLNGLRVGDRVLVTLRLTVHQPARYVAIDDALPGLFEAINPEFKTQQSRSAASPGARKATDNDWHSDHRELRTDRALFFCNEVAPGNYTIRYLARVRAAGNVIAPAAKVEEMYHPERLGLTESQPVGAKSLE